MKSTAVLLASAVFVVGCAQIPTKQLSSYTQAFTQAGTASEQVLLDFDQGLKDARSLQRALQPPAAAPSPPAPYPRTWADASKEAGAGVPDDVEVRRRAFKVVADYNAVLVQLAEGKSVEEVKASASGLLTSADKLLTVVTGAGIPGLSSLTGIVTTLVGLFEKARLREEFAQAVRKGSPLVQQILDVMIADIGSHYDVRVVVLTRDRLRALAGMRTAAETVQAIATKHNVADGDRDKLEAAVNEKMAVARAEGVKLPVKVVSGGRTAPAYSELAKAQCHDELVTLERLSKSYVDNVAAAKSLAAMLNSYRKLLETAQSSMKALVKSLDEPADVAASVDEMFAVAFALRRDLAGFRAALSER